MDKEILEYALIKYEDLSVFWIREFETDEEVILKNLLIPTIMLDKNALFKDYVENLGEFVKLQLDEELILTRVNYNYLRKQYDILKDSKEIFTVDYANNGFFLCNGKELNTDTGLIKYLSDEEFKSRIENSEKIRLNKNPNEEIKRNLARKFGYTDEEFFMEEGIPLECAVLYKSKSLMVWVAELEYRKDKLWKKECGFELYAQDILIGLTRTTSTRFLGNEVRMHRADFGTIYMTIKEYERVKNCILNKFLERRFLKDPITGSDWWIRKDGIFDKDTGLFYKSSGKLFTKMYLETMEVRKHLSKLYNKYYEDFKFSNSAIESIRMDINDDILNDRSGETVSSIFNTGYGNYRYAKQEDDEDVEYDKILNQEETEKNNHLSLEDYMDKVERDK